MANQIHCRLQSGDFNCYPGNNLFYPFILYPIVTLIRCHKTMTQIRLLVYNFMTLVYLGSRKTEEQTYMS